MESAPPETAQSTVPPAGSMSYSRSKSLNFCKALNLKRFQKKKKMRNKRLVSARSHTATRDSARRFPCFFSLHASLNQYSSYLRSIDENVVYSGSHWSSTVPVSP